MSLLQLRQVSFSYQAASSWLFDELEFTLDRGDCQLIYGCTGSGKSSLLKLILGILVPPLSGERICAPNLTFGVVMQDPSVQLLRQTLGAEVVFALENLGVDSFEMHGQVTNALRKVGLFISLETPVVQLSLGQRYRLMIAAQLVLQPDVLLLDEPWAQLDNQGVRELSALINELKSQGMAIVIVEHHKTAFTGCATHHWQLQRGRLSLYQQGDKNGLIAIADTRLVPNSICTNAPLIWSRGFKLRFGRKKLLFETDELTLHAGEVVGLIGDNGTGKSTLLKCLAGIQADVDHLDVKVLGKRPKLGIYGHSLALLHQRPSRQLFETTVIEEMQFNLKRYGFPLKRAIDMLARLGLTTLAQVSPHKLSCGQQHLIALASLACLQPQILLLDDPFAGLDNASFAKVAHLILELSQQGTAVVIASHRSLGQFPLDKIWHISQKYLQSCLPTEFVNGHYQGEQDYARVG
ncbi:ATP-binding cassette domain-containing protein [Shewanella psychrotolerans]|uniref:ATP-binding cassette domain-containing protein n=1 Tax=Shewanella psychrotolerans TaxID=2864206 RepID=UPI001C65C619|nr:ABC transporter ATP-binding protein [Shewanella psychrotolerans]QYK01281.1 energy-coupling factor ABC transporter ATP-binding protein [Shewanella psychrotolerans]